MPLKYQREVQERLKYYIYTGEVDKFKELFNVIKAYDKDRADAYLKGSEDKGRGLLSWAAEEVGSKEIMSFLLDEGADINQQDDQGNTPLHYAALDESGLNATYLLLLGADRTIKNNEGKLPVHVAYDIETNDKTAHAILEFTKEVKKTITAEDFYESLIADTIDTASSHVDALGGKGTHDASDEG